jgi:hypothetical protein
LGVQEPQEKGNRAYKARSRKSWVWLEQSVKVRTNKRGLLLVNQDDVLRHSINWPLLFR